MITLAELAIRSDTGDGRVVHGIVVPWDSPSRVLRDGMGSHRPYTESIARGAFPEAIRKPDRVKLYVNHAYKTNPAAVPIGRGLELTDDAVGLVGDFHVSKTADGDEALELVRDGVLDAFSVGFQWSPESDQWNTARTEVVRTRGRLLEASLVPFAAYAGAEGVGVRADDPTGAALRRARILQRHARLRR